MAKPQKCITVQAAKDMYNNWQNSRGSSIESDGYQDVCDFTFSLAEMQEFLDYVKDESEKADINNPGIRIYFAAYGTDSQSGATVFLAPTTGADADSDNNYDLDPFNTVGGGWPPNNY
jgi:hypothetical protein